MRFRASDDLTGKQKAVSEYLDLMASARGSGPVDQIRWGQALARVSRLTEIPVEELNRKFRTTKRIVAKPQAAPSANDGEIVNSAPVVRRPQNAQDKAERFILGTLLAEPSRWREVQQTVHAEDFTDDQRRRLAEVYWDHQRDVGEPVLNEFLSVLNDVALTELAVELVDEVEAFGKLEDTLQGQLLYLSEVRRRREEQKLDAQLRRTDGQLGEQDEVSLLNRLAEQSHRPNLRRV